LKDAIALELGNELLVRDGGFFTALGHNRQILQILQQLFVLGNRQQNSGAFTALVREILNGIAHRPEITAGSCYCRETLAGAYPPSSVNVGGARESDVRLPALLGMPIRQARRSESVRWRTGSLPAESAKLADIHLVFVYGPIRVI